VSLCAFHTNNTSAYHKYSPVAIPVDAPQLHIGLGSNRGRPRGAVYQGQLAEAASLPDAGHPFVVHIHLSHRWRRRRGVKSAKRDFKKPFPANYDEEWDTHIHLPLVDDIEIVTFVTCGVRGVTRTPLAPHEDMPGFGFTLNR